MRQMAYCLLEYCTIISELKTGFLDTVNEIWRRAGCILPLVFLTCIGAYMLLITAVDPAAVRWARQHSSGESQIQILDTPFNDTQLAEGQTIYLQYCSACHGVEGQGQFPDAPFEPDSTGRIGAPPHNETGHSWHHSDVVLIRYVTEGGFSDPARFYVMPPFGTILTEEQILVVIAHIKTLWTDEQRGMQRQLTIDEQELFSD